jgi:hypothetical protein
MAILSEGDHRRVILIPATAQVILVGGDIKRDTFVKIRYEARVLLMLSEDAAPSTWCQVTPDLDYYGSMSQVPDFKYG